MKKKVTKDRAILDAATDLFLESGYQNVSIGNIMERAGCSRETIYRYFENKEDIFASITALQMETYLDTMKSITTGESTDLREGLLNWSISLLKSVTAEDYIRFRRLVISEVNSRPDHGKIYYELTYSKGTRAVSNFFLSFQQQGKLKKLDPDLLARYFVGMLLYDIMHMRVLGVRKAPSLATIKKLAVRVVDDFLLGYACSDYQKPDISAG